LPARSCLIDGEAIVSDDNGLSVFDLIRNYRRGHVATLCAFDLLELNGQDFRAQRKAALKMLLLALQSIRLFCSFACHWETDAISTCPPL
jgi:ATP-dependent DNA ligase